MGPDMERPVVSFVIVTYNNAETIVPCLESVREKTAASYEIAVVDNSPGRATWEVLERYRDLHPGMALRLLNPEGNIGFGRACNLGHQHTTGDYLFFLNPDTMLLNDASAALLECFAKQPNAVAVGPVILDEHGATTITCRNLPNVVRIVLDATGLDRWLGAYKLMRFGHNAPSPVEQIIGAAMFVRRSDYERMCGMDEQFFIYFEEVDLCKRLRDDGREVWFWPQARVQHLAGRSCEVDSTRARMIYVLRESRRKYFAKHFGKRGGFAIECVNRAEALEKVIVFSVLWVLRRRRKDREKINGYWAVATGSTSRL